MALAAHGPDIAPASPPATTAPSRERRLVGALALVGGALAVIGSGLPWLSFFAGLTTVAGWDGLVGQAAALLGALSVGLAALYLATGRRGVRWAIAAAGFGLAGFAGWAAVNLISTLRELQQSPLLVAAPGPGLPVLVAGAVLVFVTFFVPSARIRPD